MPLLLPARKRGGAIAATPNKVIVRPEGAQINVARSAVPTTAEGAESTGKCASRARPTIVQIIPQRRGDFAKSAVLVQHRGGGSIGEDGHASRGVEKESAIEHRSPVAGKEKTPATGLKNNDILLSMKYPIYKSIMSKECDAGMNVGDIMWATEASRRVWDTLKAKGNFMIFVHSSMKLQQVTDEEAFKRIKRDFSALLKDRLKSREKKKGAGVD